MSDTAPAPQASKARDKLHASLRAAYARTAAAGGALAKQVQQANGDTDLVAHYASVAHSIVALEDLAKTAEQAAKDVRAATLESFLDSGCPEVSTPELTVYTAREPAFLEIAEPARIPKDLWTTPKPEVDRAAVKAAIKAGRDVPGATMNVRNSSRLVIRGKSQ